MSEERFTGEDKEILKRRLVLLQIEYERTAQRLQRAERREAIRRHVQNKISGQNQLLQVNLSGRSEPSQASSTVSNSDLPFNQTPLLETTKKVPQVHFLLPEGGDASPCPSPTGCRSPTNRLRSRRSRLRLQTRERESDTDDGRERERVREGVVHGEGVTERLENDETLGRDEMSGQEKVGEQAEGQECNLEVECVGEKENRDDASGWSEEANNQKGWREKRGDGEMGEEMVLRDGLRDGLSESSTSVDHQKSAEEQKALQKGGFPENQSAAEIFPSDQLEVKISPAVQLADSSSWSSSSLTDQLLMQTKSSQSADIFNQPNEGLCQLTHLQSVMEETVGVADDGCEDSVTVPSSAGKSGFLDSCTLVDGLPFPVEYYIRTTRRMTAAHSSIDLNAIIHSQLTKGRSRRRSGLPQSQRGGHMTSESSQPSNQPLDPPRSTRNGRRGRRGSRRTRAMGTTRSPTASCRAGHSQVEPSTHCYSLLELESATQSECLLQSQSSLPVEPLPQALLTPQSAADQSPGPALSTEQLVAEDFKHLSGSQLCLDCKAVPDSEVYPIFRKRCGQAEGAPSHSQSPSSKNDCTPPLPSIASLAQALRKKDVQKLGRLLTAFDLQDFHLPDDVFGQLKLERLRLSCVSAKPLAPHQTAFDACHGNSCPGISRYDFRSRIDGEHLELQLTEPANQLHSKTAGQTVNIKLGYEEDQGLEDHVQLSNTKQLHKCATDGNQSETPATELPDSQTPCAADMLTPVNCSNEVLDQGTGQDVGEPPIFQMEPKIYQPNEARRLMDEGYLSPVVPTLSFPLTSHSQHGPDSSLPSVGITPHPLTPSSKSVLITLPSSPSSQCSPQPIVPEPLPVMAPGMVAIESFTSRQGTGRQDQDMSEIGACEKDITQSESDLNPGSQKHSKTTSPPCSPATDIEGGSNTQHSKPGVVSGASGQQRADDDAGLASKRAEPTQTDVKHPLEPIRKPPHLDIQSPEAMKSPHHLDIQSPEAMKSPHHLDIQSPEAMKSPPHLDIQSPEAIENHSHLVIQSPEAMRKPHLGIQSPEAMRNPHLDTQSPEAMRNPPHLDIQSAEAIRSPEAIRNPPNLDIRSPEAMRNHLHLDIQSPEATKNLPPLDNQSPEAKKNPPHLDIQSPEVMRKPPHIDIQSPEAMRNSPHLDIQSPEAIRNPPHLDNQSPETMENPPHLDNQLPEAMKTPPHLDIKSHEAMRNPAHLDMQSPEAMRNPTHLDNQSPEAMRNPPHLDIQSPEAMKNPPHLDIQSPEAMRNPPRLDNQSPEAMRNPPHLDNESPEALRNPPHLDIQSPEAMRNPPRLDNQSPEALRNPPHLDIQSPEEMRNSPHLNNQSPDATRNPPQLDIQSPEEKSAPQKQLTETMSCKVLSCGSLEKTHSFKALEEGCVLDMCLVGWPSEGWCVCVAGEWSVCVWAQKVGVQQWNLLHTWTFTQTVISLQEVKDSAGLVCVSLARLDITEARILCCPGMDGQFSQLGLCEDAFQAVLAVSDCRLVCCPAPGTHQKTTVFTLSQDGRVAGTRSLVSTNQSIRSLAPVEGEKDALIGWTDCKTLLIWNMRSGQLLQTIQLAETVAMATCLKGYSYRGALCVLFQSASVCRGSAPFTLIATNPITGKALPLYSIVSPAPPSARLVDGDVCQSNLVGVFQSGHLAIWDLRGGVASVFEDGVTALCRLARWAGPNTLITGDLNGDVSLYQYRPTEARARCH